MFHPTITLCLAVGETNEEARGGAVVWSTALEPGRSQVRFPMVSVEFVLNVILPAALCLRCRLSR